MIKFIKSRFIDFFLCLCMSLGLIFPLFSGFILDDFISQNLINTLIISCIALLVYLMFSYNKKTIISGIVISIVVIIALSIYLAQSAILANETDNSITVSIIIILITSFLVFLANSKKQGLIALFLIGNIIIAAAYFLKFPVEIPSIIIFDLSLLISLWYRTYKDSLQLVQAGTVQSYRYIIQSTIISVIIMGLCSSVYFGVIQPIDPPTRELKLIEKLEDMKILQLLGIFSQYDQFDPNLLSSKIPQENIKGNIEGEEEDNKDGQKEDVEKKDDAKDQTNGLSHETVQKIKYNLEHFVIPWSIVIIILLIIIYIYMHFYLKRKWENRVNNLSCEDQIINYYYFFFKRLNRTSLKRIKTDTLLEYSKKMDDELSEFNHDIQFSNLTQIFMDVYYGHTNANLDQLQLFKDYYQCFYKGLRKEIGFFKYYSKRIIFRI